MKFTAAILGVLFVLFGSACATISKEALAIQVHPSNSTIVSTCQKVGPVTGSSSSFLDANWNEEGALRDIRENAVGKGDTIVLLNIQHLGRTAQAQGVIFNCYNRATASEKPASDRQN